jgi:hypothetical protein
MFGKTGTGKGGRTKGKVAKLQEKQHSLFSSNINLAYTWVYMFRNIGNSGD